MSEVCKYIHDNLKKLRNNITEKYLIMQILNFSTSNIFKYIIDIVSWKKQLSNVIDVSVFMNSTNSWKVLLRFHLRSSSWVV